MGSETSRSAALLLLIINLVLYVIIMIIAAWAVNHGIEKSHEQGITSMMMRVELPTIRLGGGGSHH